MNDLISYLLNYAFDHGISYSLVHEDPDYPSAAFPEERFIVINMNCKNPKELPFIIGHEIGHIMNGDSGLQFYYDTVSSSVEHYADLKSLKVIFNYAALQYDCFNEPIQFMQQYGIPYRMLNDTVKLFRDNDDLLF